MMNRLIALACFGATLLSVCALVWWFAFAAALETAAQKGRSDLSLAADRLGLELQRARELAVVLADHPTLQARVAGEAGAAGAVAPVLQRMADRAGSHDIRLLGADGGVLAAAREGTTLLDSARGAVTRAAQGALGSSHGLERTNGLRLFHFAAPIYSQAGPVAGAVLVSISLDAVEWDWEADPQAVYFTDTYGVIFISNREELHFLTRDIEAAYADPAARAAYDPAVLRAFVKTQARMIRGHEVWRLEAGPYLPAWALHLTLPLAIIDMQAELLLDVTPALRLATLQAAVVAALLLVAGGVLLVLWQRRAALAGRLAIEARANAQLEARVADRTSALSAANARLTREVRERREAQEALTRAQADLVQAGKLSALGKMSAGISHELNQPLMAIRSFAENAQLFMARDDMAAAKGNLARIEDLAGRMGRIIKNLRAFARQESAPAQAVDLGGVVTAALEIVQARIDRREIAVDWAAPEAPVWVRGGDVRLQQVVLNLVSNAIEAMEGRPRRRLSLNIESGDPVCLVVRDSGPGLRDAEQIFDPFYSTKEVGEAEGMGLGLSISYSIVRSFGGTLRGANHPEGGAEFVLRLAAAPGGEVAA